MNDDELQTEHNVAALYVHIPFCTAKCSYCGFYSEPVEKYDTQALVSTLIAELGRYDFVTDVRTVYIGGGSPGCLGDDLLLRLAGKIARGRPDVTEFTIEFNPEHANENILGQLRESGVNRLSIGAQSFNQNELDFLGRRHSVGCIEKAVQAGRAAGFDNVNLDLIFAIPGSSLKSWRHSLQSAIDLGVEHISAYSLTYEKGTPLQKALAAGEITAVDEETDRAMYETAIDMLADACLEQYEISNFARKGFECKHNLTYWANQPYIGIGPAAGSYWQGKRTVNIAEVKKYIEAVNAGSNAAAESEEPNAVETACQTAVLGLRRRCGIDLEKFKKQTGYDATELFCEPIARYQQLGLIKKVNGRVFLTRKALPIADSVLCDFSAV